MSFLIVCLASAFLVAFLAFLVFIVLEICLIIQKRIKKTTVNQIRKCPCYNCRFFDANPYIKCVVNPSLVLTKKAFNCLDYQSK
ncbi:hypothetical protein Nos7107_1185 [Nostoc sp. PCC 7107]|nr:hypothetical protein Nos7107_1185 [Nostoc sp. PCC 7107]